METRERGTEPSAIEGNQSNAFSLSLSKQTLRQDKKIDNSSVSPIQANIGQRKRSNTHSRIDGLFVSAWKPQVTPVGPMPSKPTPQGQTFTKTSLKTQQPVSRWTIRNAVKLNMRTTC